MADLISDYLDKLTRELSFDPALARRMREEAGDHLQEAVASDPMGATIEAERRAISRFGAARDIAAQCAFPSLLKQARSVGASVTFIAIGVLIAMKGRLAWYGTTQQIVSENPYIGSIRSIIASIDRYSFWLALLVAICGWAYISIARTSDATGVGWRNRLQQSLFVCAIAAAAVVISVTSDTILTAFRLFPVRWSTSLFFPLLTIGLEVALAALLVVRIRITMRRLALSARFFNVQNTLASEVL